MLRYIFNSSITRFYGFYNIFTYEIGIHYFDLRYLIYTTPLDSNHRLY